MYECVIEDSSGMCSLHRLGEEYVCLCVCVGGGGGGNRGVFCCGNLYYGSFLIIQYVSLLLSI